MDLRLLLDDSPAPEVTGRLRGHTSSLPASQSAPSLFPPTSIPQSYTQQQHSHRTNQPELSPREGGLAAGAGAVRGSYLGQGADGELRWAGPPPPPPAGPALPSISSFFDLRIPPTPARHPYGASSSRAYASERTQPYPTPSSSSSAYAFPSRSASTITHHLPTPSPDLTHSHSPASSSSTLPPHTPDLSYGALPSPRRKRSSTSSLTATATEALDLLAVVAHISSSAETSTSGASGSGSGSSTPEGAERRRAESASFSSASSCSSPRKRVKTEERVPSMESTGGGKKRKGRGLDPQKTRMMIFPPTLPPKTFSPSPSEGYTVRPQAAENLYAPTYTKGLDSRSRVAFCEYCGEGDLPTRMSGYGYHLLHTHNLSSHAPYIMPPPVRVRAAGEGDPTARPILRKEEVLGVPSPGLEGECPFAEGERKCVLGGWHKLNSWRESMNSHLSGRGLDGAAK